MSVWSFFVTGFEIYIVSAVFSRSILFVVAIGHDFFHEFSADCTMQSIEDASMPDQLFDISEGAMSWLQANYQKMEDMISNQQKMYSLEEWELFERWANNQSDKLDVAIAQQQTLESELQRMQVERTQMMARIDHLEQGRRETFSSVHPDYRTGMIAIERLICSATRADEQTLPMPAGDERIMDHLDKLVERMAHMEKRRMEAHEEQRGGDWDPATSLLANQPMHDLLYTC